MPLRFLLLLFFVGEIMAECPLRKCAPAPDPSLCPIGSRLQLQIDEETGCPFCHCCLNDKNECVTPNPLPPECAATTCPVAPAESDCRPGSVLRLKGCCHCCVDTQTNRCVSPTGPSTCDRVRCRAPPAQEDCPDYSFVQKKGCCECCVSQKTFDCVEPIDCRTVLCPPIKPLDCGRGTILKKHQCCDCCESTESGLCIPPPNCLAHKCGQPPNPALCPAGSSVQTKGCCPCCLSEETGDCVDELSGGPENCDDCTRLGGTCNEGSCDCDRGCTRDFKPVCGSDGITYSNECLFSIADCEANGALESTPGACGGGPENCGDCRRLGGTCHNGGEFSCDCNRGCTKELRPVCGSDGITYSNPCFFEIANCKANGALESTDGPCKSGPDNCDDCERFGGRCETEGDQFHCECDHACTLDFRPVCGSDGITYPNSCVFDIANCKANGALESTPGACESTDGYDDCKKCESLGGRCEREKGRFKCQCPTICTLELNPVCGSDGTTYGNPCQFHIANCQVGGGLEYTLGACKSGPGNCADCRRLGGTCENNAGFNCNCERACTKEYRPVCGSDRVTYGNLCMFGVAKCKANGDLTYTEGECYVCPIPGCLPPPRTCPSGSRHEIYVTPEGCPMCECCLSYTTGECVNVEGDPCADCRALGGSCERQQGRFHCNCEDRACTQQFQPVCGSDGVTYGNPCLFGIANCKAEGRLTSVPGECDEPVACPAIACLFPPKGKTCPSGTTQTPRKDERGCPICDCCMNNRGTCVDPIPVGGNSCEACRALGGTCERRNNNFYCNCEDRACTEQYQPVCGSDGVTYGNSCFFGIANCKAEGRLTSVPGECEVTDGALQP